MPPATASGSDAKPNGDAKSRDHNQGNQDRKYTIEQKAAVVRVRRCSPTAFYDILGLEEVKATVTDTEIKKAYRKLSLLTHPDKNGHEHADEAFKMVSRAFGVLSDPDKKAKYDRFGGDPDSRFGSGAPPTPSPFSARSGGGMGPMGGNAGWGDEEISPEEMFNRFFGGQMGGGFGPFGTFGFVRGSMFERHDDWFAQARREHDEILRRFFR
jgi:DnaJ family protein B protein 12